LIEVIFSTLFLIYGLLLIWIPAIETKTTLRIKSAGWLEHEVAMKISCKLKIYTIAIKSKNDFI